MKIVVAMSGGVDSSVTAGLLVEEGHEVIGLAMKTHALEPKHNRACCTPDDMRDARRVADILNVPFYVLNYAELFAREVVQPFAEAYRQGRTPNPCVECNDKVKFRPLLERAELLGADKLATGHYARIAGEGGALTLMRGVDLNKDQTYFLYRLQQEQLQRLLFPLGGMHKTEVREHARRLGLPLAEKHESQEICFVGDEGYAATVEKYGGGGKSGIFVDQDGRKLGEHDGVHRFTLGQRRGLGIAAPMPLYVNHIDAESGDVHVGDRSSLLAHAIEVKNAGWTLEPPALGRIISVRQRYREAPRAGRISSISEDGKNFRITFDEPEPRGAPGQAAVLYDGDVVLGGGVIEGAVRRRPLAVLQDAHG